MARRELLSGTEVDDAVFEALCDDVVTALEVVAFEVEVIFEVLLVLVGRVITVVDAVVVLCL